MNLSLSLYTHIHINVVLSCRYRLYDCIYYYYSYYSLLSLFYLRKQHICEVETRELFDHSLLKAACFQLRHFSSTEMSRGWRRTGGPPVISVASLISLRYIRYEHMKTSFFWSTPCFHMAFIGWFVEVPMQTSFFTCNTVFFGNIEITMRKLSWKGEVFPISPGTGDHTFHDNIKFLRSIADARWNRF